ncbi:MAG: hypothetical protein ABSD71_11910 [Bacteroidales bacterium]|jgi:hypothetical protein
MANPVKNSAYYESRLNLYRQLVAVNTIIEIKGATVPYTSCNGHMFSYLEKDGSFGLRLPPKSLDEFLKRYSTTLFKSYGIIKKEFALVPDELFTNTEELLPYFELSFEYVKSLKPK